jgi:large subunit ribosomal protein L29
LEKPARIRTVRRDIARIKTLQGERQAAAIKA